jgi:hypothetical protein
MLSDEELIQLGKCRQSNHHPWGIGTTRDIFLTAARAIEFAATAPLLARIAELTRELEEARKDANTTAPTGGVSSTELGGQKPRLRREWSLTCKRQMWVCRGGVARGMGDCPGEAYWNWKWYGEHLSNFLPPNTPISGGTSAA